MSKIVLTFVSTERKEIEMKKIIYPMSMLNEIVGKDNFNKMYNEAEKSVKVDGVEYDFDTAHPFFRYDNGILESLDNELANCALNEMGFTMYRMAA